MALLDELLAQLEMNGSPLPLGGTPTLPQSPYLPAQTSSALGLGYPTPLMSEMPGSSPLAEEPAAEPTAPAQYGYTPQPRPALPPAIADDATGLYGPFRDVYEGLRQEEDPLAALMTPEAAAPAPRLLRTQEGPVGFGQGYGGGAMNGLSPAMSRSAQTLLRRSPAYGRVIDRMGRLQAMRARKGL